MAADPVRARAIFLDAIEIDAPDRRASFLEHACAGDDALRRRVQDLIEAHERPESLLDRAAAAVGPPPTLPSLDDPDGDAPGARVGP